jgi:hypothetical protein
MSIEYQHILVYGIVFSAFLKLIFPFLEMIYKKLFLSKSANKGEDPFSCYTPVCSKCKIKE